MEKPKILVFNVNWMGDVLFSTPAIRLIRKTYPGSFIAVIVTDRCREVLEGNPNLNEIIIYDEYGRHKGLFGKLKFVGLLHKKRFDKVFLFHRSFTRALITFIAGIPERIGYYTRKRFYLLTTRIKRLNVNKLHRADYYLHIVKTYEAYQADVNFRLDFFIPEDTKISIDSLLHQEGIKDDDFIVVLNSGGNWAQKRWPKENFAVLSNILIRDYDARIILSGAEKDRQLAEEITQLSGMDIINLCGRINLKQLAALMQRASLVVSNDSGPLHIASSVGARVIGLFGPTSVLITGPYKAKNSYIIQEDVGCAIPCYKQGCSDLRCMKAVTVDTIVKEIKKII